MFGVHRMVADGTRSNQKLLALREKGLVIGFANEFQAVQGPSLISVR
jgi:hypothetical protein